MKKDELTPTTDIGAEGTESQAIDQNRRKLAKAGLGAGAVIASLASRPVFANACTISGMMSGNASHPGEKPCEGCTPGYWGAQPHMDSWPTGFNAGDWAKHDKCDQPDATGTRFHDWFGGDMYGNLSLLQVMHLQGGNPGGCQILPKDYPAPGACPVGCYDAKKGECKVKCVDPYQLGAHAAAALLNAASGINYGYEVGDITSMYNSAYASDPEGLKEAFRTLNERYCPLN